MSKMRFKTLSVASIAGALLVGTVFLSTGCTNNQQTPPPAQTAQQINQAKPQAPEPPMAPPTPTPKPPVHEAKQTTPMTGSEIGVIDFDKIMEMNPRVKAGQEAMNSGFEALQKEIEKLPESERMKAWQEKQEALAKKVQDEYFTPAKEETDVFIEQVMQEKGMKALITKYALIKGGEDITDDVIAKIEASK